MDYDYTRAARDPLEKEAYMNTIPMKEENVATTLIQGESQGLMKKLPWSLVFAAIPFIPDILETIRSIPDLIAKNGYALYVKHGQTEVHFNRAENVGKSVTGGANDEQDD